MSWMRAACGCWNDVPRLRNGTRSATYKFIILGVMLVIGAIVVGLMIFLSP